MGTDPATRVVIGDNIPKFTLSAAGAASAYYTLGVESGTTDNNQLITLAEGYDQSGLGGGSVGTNKTMCADRTSFFDTSLSSGTVGYYSGAAFDGRYIYLAPLGDESLNISGSVTRYDTTGSFSDIRSYTTFDTRKVSTFCVGFRGAVFDGRYLYFVPAWYTYVARYDTRENFNVTSSYTIFNLSFFDNGAKYYGGVFDGRYVYFSPYETSTITRYDTTLSFTVTSSYTAFSLSSITPQIQNISTYDGRYVYYMAPTGGSDGAYTVIRYDTSQPFRSSGSYTCFNMKDISSTAGAVGAVFDSRYLYFVPYRGTLLIRYDTQRNFNSAESYATFDVTNIDTSLGTFKYSGGVFDGRYVYFAPDNGVVLRYDTTQNFYLSSSYTAFSTFALNSRSQKFLAAVFDGRRVYFVPYRYSILTRIEAYPGPQALAFAANQAPNGFAVGTYAGSVVPPSTTLLVSGDVGMSTSSPQYTLDVNGTIRAEFVSGAVDILSTIHSLTTNNQTISLAEGNNQGGLGGGAAGLSKTMSANTTAFLDTTAVSAGSKGFAGAVFDGVYLYLAPGIIGSSPAGTVTRYDTREPFVSGNCTCFDLRQVNSNCVYFWGALFDKRYLYFIPYNSGTSGFLTRFDTTQQFDSVSSYSVFNLTAVCSSAKGFIWGVFDGRFVYFVPSLGGTSGLVTRYDTNQDFYTPASYSTFDTTVVSTFSAGFYGAVFDGRYIYFVPNQISGVNTATITRFDTTQSFVSASSYTCFNIESVNSKSRGFIGGVYDGRYAGRLHDKFLDKRSS